MKAECTWGDGPDVLVILEGTKVMLYEDPIDMDRSVHGYTTQGSFCLTVKEALTLAGSLYVAAGQAMELDNSYRDYVIKEQDEDQIR